MGSKKMVVRSHTVRRLCAGLLLVLTGWGCAGLAQAGEVVVSFQEPLRYADIGFGAVTRERNLKTLQDHMEAWGARLPAAQRLEIEVLDVDLAGIEQPVGREPFVRVLNGKVDSPRATLRWTLRQGASVLASGRDELGDLGYAHRLALGDRLQPLYYDRRMLDEWLQSRVVERSAAGAAAR